MNKKKFNKYLKKINSFEEWMGDLEELSVGECDLLRDYIQKLEVAISDGKGSIKKSKKNKFADVTIEEKEKSENTEPETKPSVEKTIEVETDKHEIPFKEPIEEEVLEEDDNYKKEYSEEFLELFNYNGSSDLSEKLSSSPIKDLRKAFSINERIFAVNELFAGDKEAFKNTVESLEECTSIEKAKNYILNNIADRFGWDEKEMIKKVKHFIKTVKRRYI